MTDHPHILLISLDTLNRETFESNRKGAKLDQDFKLKVVY